MKHLIAAGLIVLLGFTSAWAGSAQPLQGEPTIVTLIPLGNKAPGIYPFGPVPIPDAVTLLILTMDRGNIFIKPDFRALVNAEAWFGTEFITGCLGGALGGQRTFQGQPIVARRICDIQLPEVTDLVLQGTMTVTGDSGNVELLMEMY